ECKSAANCSLGLRPSGAGETPALRWIASLRLSGLLSFCLGLSCGAILSAAEVDEAGATATLPKAKSTMRIGATHPRSRLIDWRLTNATEVLERVDKTLSELEQLVHQAAAAGCDALAFPEDTLGLGHWEAAHKPALKEVLPDAVQHMRHRLGRAA